MGLLRRAKKLAIVAWRAFARVAETVAQCFIILPWYFLYERVIHDLQSVVARGGSDGGEGDDEEELNVMRLVAHLILSYFDRGETKTTPPPLSHRNAHRLPSPRSPRSPPSIYSPPRGGMTWANELLQQSWGHIAECATAHLLPSLNKVLKDKVVSSHAIKRMTLASMSLGSKPPSILWVKVLPKIQAPSQSSDVEMLVLQVAFDWQSDMNGLLTILTHMISKVDLQCADVCVKGVIHIVLGPLCSSVPPFQRASAYFLVRPKVALKVRLLSDLLAMNVEVTDTVGRMVKSQLKSFALWPKFIEIPLSR